MSSEQARKEIPMTDDCNAPLFEWPSENPQLIGGKCTSCKEVIFPFRPQCPRCFTETMEKILLSRKGKVFSSTLSYLAPSAFKGEVPYGFGNVELPEGVLISCRFSPTEKPIPIGTEVELEIKEWGEDEKGNMVMMHTFKLIQ